MLRLHERKGNPGFLIEDPLFTIRNPSQAPYRLIYMLNFAHGMTIRKGTFIKKGNVVKRERYQLEIGLVINIYFSLFNHCDN